MSEIIPDISKVELTGHKLYKFSEIASEHAYWGGKHLTLTVDNPFESATLRMKTKVLAPYNHGCSVPNLLVFNFIPPGGNIWIGEIIRIGKNTFVSTPVTRYLFSFEYYSIYSFYSADFNALEWFWDGKIITFQYYSIEELIVPPGKFYIHSCAHPNAGTYDYLPWHHSNSSTTLLDKFDLDNSWIMLVPTR